MVPSDDDRADDGADDGAVDPLDHLLADGFERMAPQGGAAWHTADALLRLDEARNAADRLLGHATGMLAGLNPAGDGKLEAGIVHIRPWAGLEAAVGDTAGRRSFGRLVTPGSLANALAEDNRKVVGDVAAALVAMVAGADRQLVELAAETAGAVRSLAARIEQLEARTRIVDDVFPGHPGGVSDADLAAAAGSLPSWFAIPEAEGTVLHADAGDGSVLRALADVLDPAVRPVVGADPRADRAGQVAVGGPTEVHLATAAELLAATPRRSLAGAVLTGCIERGPLADALVLASSACGALAPGGRLALLVPGAGGTIEPDRWAGALAAFGLHDVGVAEVPPGTVVAVTGVAW